MSEDLITLKFGGETYMVSPTLGLVETLEDHFGSLVKILQDIKGNEFKTMHMIDVVKVSLSYSGYKETVNFEDLLKQEGLSGIIETVVKIISPLVAGVRVIDSIKTGETAGLGKP